MLRYIHITILLSSLQALVSATCYYPDGTEGSELVPCNVDAEVSHCCRAGDICLSNRLCFSSGLGAVIRRGCTSQDWNSTACPGICIDDVFRKGDAVLTGCGQYNQFCCGQSKEARACCDGGNSSEIIIIPAGDSMNDTAVTTVTVIASSTSGPDAGPKSAVSKLKQDIKNKNNIIYALAAVFAAAMLGVIVLGLLVWRKRGIEGPKVPKNNSPSGAAVGAHRMSVLNPR